MTSLSVCSRDKFLLYLVITVREKLQQFQCSLEWSLQLTAISESWARHKLKK